MRFVLFSCSINSFLLCFLLLFLLSRICITYIQYIIRIYLFDFNFRKCITVRVSNAAKENRAVLENGTPYYDNRKYIVLSIQYIATHQKTCLTSQHQSYSHKDHLRNQLRVAHLQQNKKIIIKTVISRIIITINVLANENV